MSIIEQYTHPFVHALGWSLLHSLWQIALIAFLLKLALKFASAGRAGLRYQISLLAMVAIPISFIVSFLKQWEVYRNAMPVVSLDFGEESLPVVAVESQLVVIQKSSSVLMHILESYTPQICRVYLIGLLLFIIYSVFSYMQTRVLRQRSKTALPGDWQNKIKTLCRKTGFRRLIPVYMSERVHVPAVVGFLKPVVLLPLSLLSSLSPSQIETILLHELYHIKRYDHYIHLFQHLTETIFFYHPLTWWIGSQLRLERESRVDEWVVKETGRPLEYANALIELECSRNISLPLAVAATQSKSQLFTRIKNIMTMKTRSMHSGQVAAIIVILTAAISIAWINPAVVTNYPSSDQGHELHSDLPYPQAFSLMPEEEVTEAPPPTKNPPQPRTVKLADGKVIEWDSLGQEDKEQIRKALEEARIAVATANKEVLEAFNSEEFKAQMALAREEVRKALQEVDRELSTSIRSEAFRQEMEQVKTEVARAMEEMEKSLEGIGPAVQEGMKELNIEEMLKEIQKSLEQISKEEKQTD